MSELDRMIETHSLPADTRARLRQRLEQIRQFPFSGQILEGRWAGHQRVLGPFAWLASIYVVEDDIVKVLTIEDCRQSTAARSR